MLERVLHLHSVPMLRCLLHQRNAWQTAVPVLVRPSTPSPPPGMAVLSRCSDTFRHPTASAPWRPTIWILSALRSSERSTRGTREAVIRTGASLHSIASCSLPATGKQRRSPRPPLTRGASPVRPSLPRFSASSTSSPSAVWWKVVSSRISPVCSSSERRPPVSRSQLRCSAVSFRARALPPFCG